jgi:ABC-2 type transport system permease protein
MADTLSAIYTIWLREIKRFIKSRSRVIGTGGQPLIWIAIFGVGLGAAFTLPGGQPYITFMAPGIIGMTLLFTSLFAGINVIWDKQFGFLKEIMVAPISRVSIVLGKVIGTATIALLSALVILIVVVVAGVIPFHYITPMGLIEAIAFMLLISSIFVSVGLIIASFINNIEGFQVIVNFLIFPLFFLSGAVFPLTTAPVWMKVISSVDPLYYGVDGMRGALIGAHALPIYVDMAIVVVVMIVFVAIADIMFRRMQAK